MKYIQEATFCAGHRTYNLQEANNMATRRNYTTPKLGLKGHISLDLKKGSHLYYCYLIAIQFPKLWHNH